MNRKLTTLDYYVAVGVSDNPELDDNLSYQKLIGKLLYVTITRPDICFAVQMLSQFMQRPKYSHLDSSLRIVRYLKDAPDLGILLPAGDIIITAAFCDVLGKTRQNTRRLVTEYVIMLGCSLVSWKFKKQHTISKRSAETEYRSMAIFTAEIIWLTGLLRDSDFVLSSSMGLFCDSKLADLLTKGLTSAQHHSLLSKLGVFDVYHPSSLRGSIGYFLLVCYQSEKLLNATLNAVSFDCSSQFLLFF
ncbi:uncharacterized mitochondrial protein AtMg00810-like [Solanum stenotomum]|uniref:uncharacterized mitochondrial protein AtMg00810-like n=1 Tax=Solanum stenotomum TaxID=172797 RepID=UPI0020D10618|nr:uncharacterized mitochondrial protein AtMg00810-like [Solanum stenotomum]